MEEVEKHKKRVNIGYSDKEMIKKLIYQRSSSLWNNSVNTRRNKTEKVDTDIRNYKKK